MIAGEGLTDHGAFTRRLAGDVSSGSGVSAGSAIGGIALNKEEVFVVALVWTAEQPPHRSEESHFRRA